VRDGVGPCDAPWLDRRVLNRVSSGIAAVGGRGVQRSRPIMIIDQGESMPPIGLAVIGAGYWGPNLVRSALTTPGLSLQWLCDLDIERVRRVLGPRSAVAGSNSYEEVLADPNVAAVAIATPAATHFDLVRAALEAGKHVLVEKPLTSTVAEGRKLADIAQRNGLVLMCDHTYCYTPAVQRIRQLIRNGEIGDIQFIDSVRINLGLIQPDVDVLWDLAPHDLSILDFVLPDDVIPIAVAAHTGDPLGAGRACLAYLSVWLSNGSLAHVHVNWLSPTKIRTTLFGGSRRTIVWDDMNPVTRVMIHDRGVDLVDANSLEPDERRQALISYRVGDMHAPALPEREALLNVMAEFAGAIGENRQPLTDGAFGIRVLELLEAASVSAEHGGTKIVIDRQGEK
jgi:predicted dehydrogenase